MHHFLVDTNPDIKRRKNTENESQQYIQLIIGAKDIQQLNPGGPEQRHNIRHLTVSSTDKSLSRNRHRE